MLTFIAGIVVPLVVIGKQGFNLHSVLYKLLTPKHATKHRDDDGVNSPDKAQSEHQEEKPL